MTAGSHLFEIFVRAPGPAVWEALTEPAHTERWFGGARVESSFRPGEKWRLVRAVDDVDVVEGEIETFDPPHRLVMTWRGLGDEAMAAEPPSRVEWTLTRPDGSGTVTRVTVRHAELALSPLTWEHVRVRWVAVVDSLKSYLETGEPLPALDTEDSGLDAEVVEGHWHRAQAVAANNSVWELLDGRPLRPDEIDELLERAYAAAFHWRRASGSTIVNRARAAYLISRAHAYCGHGDVALHHADRCVELVGQAPDDVADFDHAYAYEARARALAASGRVADATEARRRAAAVIIADEQDRSIFAADLADGPWYDVHD